MKLSDFEVDTRAIQDGTWITVGGAYGDLEIMSRGFTDEFIDAKNAREARASDRYGGDRTRIPNHIMREINAVLLSEFLIIDVRNLTDEQDEPVSVSSFHQMLSDQRYSRLAAACWEAARRVSSQSVSEVESAVGNSVRPSKVSSNGANLERD